MSVSLSAMSRRFLIDCTLCLCCRHSSLDLWYVLGGAPGWSHAGSWSLRRSDSFSGAKFTLCFLIAFNRFVIIFGTRLALVPRVGGAQEVKRLLMGGKSFMLSGFRLFTMASVTKAQAGLELDKSMNALIQVTSIASFLAFIFSMPRPPSAIGLSRRARLIGGVLRASHMNVRIFFVIAVSIDLGIPCALVRNWVIPPMIIWIISRFPSREG